MAKPYITVLIDTYNHERFIEQAIKSVLEQDRTMEDVEIVVVDDGSTDRTPEIVSSFAPRVRLVRKPNGGQGSAFNTGIPECRGEIVALLDGDDWWTPDKLRKVLAAFSANPEIGMVGHGTIVTYPDGAQFTDVLKEPAGFSLNSVEGMRMFGVRKSFLGTRVTVRADVLRRLLPVPEEIRIEADEFVFTMAAAFCNVYVLPEALFHYRIHENNQFSLDNFDARRVGRKQQSLSLLAEQLSGRLRAAGVSEEVARGVVRVVKTEADQLRLSIAGGYPWETVQAELFMYHHLHGDASWAQWTFKCLSLLPAMILPPRLFYRGRRWVASNKFYLRARKSLLPIPQPAHTVRQWKADV